LKTIINFTPGAGGDFLAYNLEGKEVEPWKNNRYNRDKASPNMAYLAADYFSHNFDNQIWHDTVWDKEYLTTHVITLPMLLRLYKLGYEHLIEIKDDSRVVFKNFWMKCCPELNEEDAKGHFRNLNDKTVALERHNKYMYNKVFYKVTQLKYEQLWHDNIMELDYEKVRKYLSDNDASWNKFSSTSKAN
tara:strand:+ start:2724 stop:3290 length:567 start_codon:yes stop_codon:yes gene_type:complete